MSFYKELSSVYDMIFPKDKNTVDFLTSNLQVKSKVLDLACGTGTYAIALGEKGYEVIGVDLDETMIQLAKDKISNENVHFCQANMMELNEVVKLETFNLVYCIGNSIVHLNNMETIEELALDVYNRLENQGEFIVQIINYDRILKNGIKGLPTIERNNGKIKFVRNYKVKEVDKKVYFDTELIINIDGIEEKYENSVPLLPITSKDLLKILIKAGFSKVGIHGGFLNEEYSENSYAVIMRAVK